jgi:DMSO/TMAO reductase YedYZ molybdopterin-dependent catalytic subunit/mono/diheme cytochrome c family protein
VRNNLPMPQSTLVANPDAWTVQVKGCQSEGDITLADLKLLPTTTVAAVLQCSGNGRAFFDHKPSGSPWSVGAAGCALWTGVRVADVLAQFGGANNDASFLTGTGGEMLPEGIDPQTVAVERSVPLDKGLDDCLLVWEMNGEPLPLVHGGPVRLLVPGYFGVNNVKWLRTLAATMKESSNKIQQSGYRLRPVGKSGNVSHPSMYRMPVKSWVNSPGADGKPIPPGRHRIFGVAFAGERGIESVEVSLDGGSNWRQAMLYGPDLGANAWRTFSLDTELDNGEYLLVSRATDKTGAQQPADFPANQRGYGHNGWRDHGLSVAVSDNTLAEARLGESNPGVARLTATETVATGAGATYTAKEAKPRHSEHASLGRQLFNHATQPSCATCHSLDAAGAKGVIGPNLDKLKPDAQRIRAALAQGVGAMPSYAEQLSDNEVSALVDFITQGR